MKNTTIFKRLLGYLKAYRLRLFFVLLSAVISTAFMVLAPFLVGKVTTTLFASIADKVFYWETIIWLLAALAALYFVSQLFSFLQGFGMAKITANVMQTIRREIDEKMHRLKLNYYDVHTHGDILSVITNDVDTINNTISQNLTSIVTQVTTAIGVLIMMLMISPKLSLIPIVMVPLSLLSAAGVMKASEKYYGEQQELLGKLNGYVEEMYNGQSVVQTFNYQERAKKKFSQLNDALKNSSRKAETTAGAISPITTLVNDLGYVLCAALGCLWVIAGKIAVGNVQAMLEYTWRFAEPALLVANFLLWMFMFGILFWCVTSLRAMFRMKKAYWTERTLTAKMLRKMKNKGEESGGKIQKKVKSIGRKIRNFFARQYDALLHLDFQDKTNRTILRVVLINFAILFVVCLFWWYGTVALIVYSVMLFMFLKKYTQDLSEKYALLLKSTNQLAEGHLDIPIEGDVGLFNPIQEELKRIQKGFKKAVDEEVKNERMKTELVTNVSHDLRTPLTAIITYTDLLKNEKDEEKRKEYISVLERKSLRLKVLIEDLFEISKAASKSVVMHFMKVDIVGLFKQVELENVEKIKAANLEFRTKIPEQKVVMWLDSEKTYRIFENLIVNITKYAMPHTRVYIDMTETEDGVHITMKNVSAAELNFNADEITDRFVRGDSARNTEGSGLGLAIAKSFAELQHGSLKISTEADLFKADLYLPKSKEMPEKPGGGVS